MGQAGVEYYYENLLQGIRGEQTVKVDASGNVTAQAGAVPAEPGSDIKLTIDVKIQQACEEGLKISQETAERTGYPGGAGACVCLDCTNGDVLGMASFPSFDPSVFVGGISSDIWSELNDDKGGRPLVNRVVGGQYMSASTIKPLSSFAGMEYGVYTARPDPIAGAGGPAWAREAASGAGCTRATASVACRMASGTLATRSSTIWARTSSTPTMTPRACRRCSVAWGLGSKTGVDLPAEGVGRVPDAEWKESYFKDWSAEERAWNAGDMTNIAIGQGDILVTPIQMATAYAGIAMNGVEYTPHVLHSVVARDGQGDAYTFEPKKRLTVELKNQDSQMGVVHAGLHSIIYEESPALAEHFKNLPVQVAGKSRHGREGGGGVVRLVHRLCSLRRPQIRGGHVVGAGRIWRNVLHAGGSSRPRRHLRLPRLA